MVREVITVAALTAAFSFLGGCTPRAATLPGFRSETKEFSQSGETFGNPLMGYAPDARRENVSEDITLLYVDITWKELEPECGVYDWDTIEKENQFFRWRSEGKHLVLRFICDDPGDESHTDIPDWLYRETGKDGDWYDNDYGKGFAPDYSNTTMIRRHTQAVKAMGERWGSDSLISYIELGSLGHWGEWHVYYGAGIRRLPLEEVREQYVKVWPEAFPNAMILMRRPFCSAKNYGFGLYNDMAGHPEDTKTWIEWIENGGVYDQTGETDVIVPMNSFWKKAPVGGELNSSISMRRMLVKNLNETAELIRSSHTTFLGPKIADKSYLDGYQTLLKNMGYRIWITQAQLKQALGKATLILTWENDGTAPFYKNWPVVVTVTDSSGAVIEEKTLDWKISELMLGEKNVTTVKLDTRGLLDKARSDRNICVEIRDPMTEKAAVRLANKELDQKAQKKQMIVFKSGE